MEVAGIYIGAQAVGGDAHWTAGEDAGATPDRRLRYF
jgi:hypothetical protein